MERKEGENMTVENSGEVSGLARLDAVQRGEQLPPPVPLAQVVGEWIPPHATNKQRRDLKRTCPDLIKLAKQELGR